MLLDVALLFSVLMLCFTYDLSILKFNEVSLFDYHATMLTLRTNEASQSYFGILGFCIWVKVLFLFRLNSLFGPLLTIFQHMGLVILQFSLLLVLVSLTFAISGHVLFSSLHFSSLQESFVTLFSWMLGEFSFSSMREESWAGELFLSLFLLVCMLLMVNLLIALLSTTYSRLSSQAVGLYLENIIQEQPRWVFRPRFNFFSYRVPLLNVLTLLSLPCLSKCSSRCKHVLEKIHYVPAFEISLVLVVAVDLVFLPLAWMRVIKKGCLRREARLILFGIFLFPLVGLLMCVLDFAIASWKLWDSSSFKACTL